MAKQRGSKPTEQGPKSRQPVPRRRVVALLPALGALVVLAFLLTAGGFGFAATQEQHDAFCASCHTQPESTYYQRSVAAQPADLASAHTKKDVQCIGCHSGPGLTGRMSAELLGAHNALAWYSGTAVQPAKLTHPVTDADCLKCHQQVTESRSRNNHFHYFLARWQAVDPKAATCVSCHTSHTTDGSADQAWMAEQRVRDVCSACHAVAGEGD